MPLYGVMPVPRQRGQAVESWRATALRMNSLLLGMASRRAARSGSTLNATMGLLGLGLRGTAPSLRMTNYNAPWTAVEEGPWTGRGPGPTEGRANSPPRRHRGPSRRGYTRARRNEVASRVRSRRGGGQAD